MAKRPKRPRDPNQLAKLIVDISVGNMPQDPPTTPDSPLTVARRQAGMKGAKARGKKLSAKKRTAIAKKAARARWG